MTDVNLSQLPLIVAIALIIAGAMLLFLTLKTHPIVITVNECAWKRIIKTEELRAIRRDCSSDSVPEDAYDCKQYVKQWETLETRYAYSFGKSGLQLVTIPVSHTELRTRYTRNEWLPSDDLIAIGTANQDREWPLLPVLASDGIGSKREAGRSEILFITFTQGERRYVYETPKPDEWERFTRGQQYTLRVNAFGAPFWETLHNTSDIFC